MGIAIKRVYEKPEEKDGARILVDRLWPRGLTKKKAKIDLWLKEVAPSTELRKWFGHEAPKWDEFQARYKNELKNRGKELSSILEMAAQSQVTLVYGAKDEVHNDAVLLQKILLAKLKKTGAN
jgi:uncharacterized protein YeaO (DUF488 family)